MFNWFTDGLGSLFNFGGSLVSSATGWAWDKVTGGIYTWLANGLALLMEWVWGVLDHASTPHVTADWFRTGIAGPIGGLALAVTIALMMASATQAALAGRPEQIGDAVKEGVRVIVASALTLAVIDVMVGIVDEASAMVWRSGRADLVNLFERLATVAAVSGPLSHTFIGPLCLLVGFVGLIGLVVSLMMRDALIYVAAALAPLVWSSSVLPMFRSSARKLVHLLVSLIVSKLAIVVTLLVAVKMIANAGAASPATTSAANDGASAVGALMAGFICFLLAAVTPFVLYKLMPTVEGAMIGAGVAGGWGRSATNAAHTALMVKSFGASAGASAATRAVSGQGGVPGGGGGGSGGGPVGAFSGLGRSTSGATSQPSSAHVPPTSGSAGGATPASTTSMVPASPTPVHSTGARGVRPSPARRTPSRVSGSQAEEGEA